jgi:hypothetical protein
VFINTIGFYVLLSPNDTLGDLILGLLMTSVGWYMSVVGFGFALVYRLDLVHMNKRWVKWARQAILLTIAVFMFPTTVATYGKFLDGGSGWEAFFNVIEVIQVTAIGILNTTLGLGYIYGLQTMTIAGTITPVMKQTFVLQCVDIALYVTVVALELFSRWSDQVMFKQVVTAISLKLEFAMLILLTKSIRENKRSLSMRSTGTSGSRKRPSRLSARPSTELLEPEQIAVKPSSRCVVPTNKIAGSTCSRGSQEELLREELIPRGENSSFSNQA